MLCGIAATGAAHAAKAEIASLRIDDLQPGALINPLIYGSNEIGVMDGGARSADLDAAAGVTVRRLGGDLMTAYNWTNNATNAGKNHRQANGAFLLEALQVPPAQWSTPAIVIETMHRASLAMGARTLVTLPVGRYVAADLDGEVETDDAAPSRRFVPVLWDSQATAIDPIDGRVCDIPQLLRRLIAGHGTASEPTGIAGYILDNEPAIWFQNHPRLSRERLTIRQHIDASVAAARMIKSIDPAALVLGPASWGATEFVSFQDAPDWRNAGFDNYLGAYLAAFRAASERDGRRLLDCLDIHWYPFSDRGALFRSEDGKLDQARLDAPRGLTEAGYVEQSWVPRALARSTELALPILPSLKQLIERHFPGTGLAVTEFNYGGAGQLTSGLALADALGRYGAAGVTIATHWGSLERWLGEAYRLFRHSQPDFPAFEGRNLTVLSPQPASLTAYAALGSDATIQLVIINKSRDSVALPLDFTGTGRRVRKALGFDMAHPQTMSIPIEANGDDRLSLPPLSARRYILG